MRDKGHTHTPRWKPPLARELGARRRAIFVTASLGIIFSVSGIALEFGVGPVPRLLWNASASVPPGLYAVAPAAPIGRGEILVARLPKPAAVLAAARHYLPINVPLVKPVGAVPGDRVCAIGASITINNKFAAKRRVRDRAGRLLPWWSGCTLLRDGRLFLLSSVPDSFDSRYFGPIKFTAIIGRARPIWTEPMRERRS